MNHSKDILFFLIIVSTVWGFASLIFVNGIVSWGDRQSGFDVTFGVICIIVAFLIVIYFQLERKWVNLKLI